MIENQTFRLLAGADEDAFRVADARAQQEIAYQQRGLLRRTTARSDEGEWLVSTLWSSAADADAAVQVLDTMHEHIDVSSIRTTRYVERD